MKKIYLYFLAPVLCICFLTWQACQKVPLTDFPPIVSPQELVNATIQGRVLNGKNEPVSGALVKMAGNASTTTDINGSFRFNNIRINKNAGFVQVEKAAYFTGSRTLVVNKDTVNYLQVELIPKIISGSFTAASGGSITVVPGGTIEFLANSVVTSNTNTPYVGAVSVSASFLNPEAPNFLQIMPGDLRGVTTGNQERGLESFGMMVIELSGSSGEKLQLAAGKKATIHFPIPSTLQTAAPSVIPLWYFNDSTGLWKEEGSATRVGNNYSGTVSHFSIWNCDAPFPLIDFEAKFVDQNGNPISGSRVYFHKIKSNVAGNGYTDAAGTISGKIPTNEALIMDLYDKCGNIIFTKNVGPFTADQNLGTVTINVPMVAPVTITGTVNDCSSQPLNNGYVNISLDGMYYRTNVNNGQFSIIIQRCTNAPSTAQIYAADLAANQQGPYSTLQVSNSSVNAGQLSACGISTLQYINYTIDGIQYNLNYPSDSMMVKHYTGTDATASVFGYSVPPNPNKSLSLRFETGNFSAGMHPVLHLYITQGSIQYNHSTTMALSITEYGGFGQFITGTVEGSVSDTTNRAVNFPVSVQFRVRRIN